MSLLFTLLAFGPLLAGVALMLGGRWLGVRGSRRLTQILGGVQLASLAYFYSAFGAEGGSLVVRLDYGVWFTVGELRAQWGFLLDPLSLLMVTLVVVVSLVTQLYSYWYLAEDPHLVRFQSYLQLFTFAMLMLVTADNFGVFFLGWEGVGLCSFLLIGFWSTRPEARRAALKAVTVNRLGDAAFLGGVGLLVSLSGSLEFATNFLLLPLQAGVTLSLGGFEVGVLPLALGLLLVAIAAKSAQLGLHTWLADAMEGPTPVSALIHAATMVTAGIYLAIRCSQLFALAPAVGEAMALLGGYTALFGASVACCQWDLKKVIAYSTCSQLGYMLCACGMGGYGLAFHHLLTHGFFKALLFLAAGVLIHQLGGEQDLRRMGGLLPFLPLTFSYFGVGFGALLGLPGTSGFYSKESILELLSTHSSGSGRLCYLLLLGALVCTAFYSCRTLSYAFGGTFRGGRGAWVAVTAAGRSELPLGVVGALGLLVVATLFGEALLHPYLGALGGGFLRSAGVAAAADGHLPFGEGLASPNRLLPLLAMGVGFGAFRLGEALGPWWGAEAFTTAAGGRFRALLHFLQRGWYFDGALSHLCFGALGPLTQASLTLEKGVLEWVGPFGVGSLLGRGQRWLDLANLGRSIFGTLGLVAVAYGLLLAYTLGV